MASLKYPEVLLLLEISGTLTTQILRRNFSKYNGIISLGNWIVVLKDIISIKVSVLADDDETSWNPVKNVLSNVFNGWAKFLDDLLQFSHFMNCYYIWKSRFNFSLC